MAVRRGIASISLLLLLSGCQLPQWRVFKAEVPAPVTKPEKQVEAERAAADLIARTIEEPHELRPVAEKLSESLGCPSAPIAVRKPDDLEAASRKAAAAVQAGIVEQQKRQDRLNDKLAKYQGKAVEGTGFNLFGPSMGALVVGLVALGIACPPVFTVLFFLLRRTKDALRHTVSSIEQFSVEEPEAAAQLKALQSRAMDAAHKRVIKKLKSTL